MKSIPIIPFKHVDGTVLTNAEIIVDRCSFEYTDNTGIHQLIVDDTARDNQYYIHDSRGWSISDQGMRIQFHMMITNPSALYSITSPGALLSVGAIASSKESNRTEAIELSTINKNGMQEIQTQLELKAGFYRNEIKFRIVIYLKESGNRTYGTAHLPGTILGVVDEFQVVFDKVIGLFPTEIVSNPGEPLWWIVCRWSDISEDSFSKENLILCLNSSNPDYPRIDPDSPSFDPSLFIESMSSAVTTLIMEAKDQPEWIHVVNGDVAEDTIAFMLSYMINTLNWDSRTPSSLSRDIHAYMQKEMKQ